MADNTENLDTSKLKVVRCREWLQNQNDPKKLSLQNQNDIQFIIETNAHRKKFLLSAADDHATVPAGIDEPSLEPQAVPLRKLRQENLQMLCEWQSCMCYFTNYEQFQKHVTKHASDLHVIDVNGSVEYVCLWDICGHKTSDFNEMVRHINYHAYHARLLAIGFNGRATLKLERCKKDSTKRNQLPPLKSPHCCMWVGCSESFNSIQAFFDHVKAHIYYSDEFLCSWAGCGAVFPRRVLLTMHVRSHTKERLIACFHCGHHFACNRKLSDHLLRQNVHPGTGFECSMCGLPCASAYLTREHERQHVSAYACALCDMSAPSPAALAHHARYRHLADHTRSHACAHCPYRAVTKWDLLKHIPTHTRKRKRKRGKDDSNVEISEENSDGEKRELKKNVAELSEEEEEVKKKVKKKYACHMCPEKEVKVFSRGTRLTTHLVKVHGAQWPFGHSRFSVGARCLLVPVHEDAMRNMTAVKRAGVHCRAAHWWLKVKQAGLWYQISEDGMYRLTTTRFEFEDVSKKIVDGYSWPKESLTNDFEFDLKRTADATETSPQKFEITLKSNKTSECSDKNKENMDTSEDKAKNSVEIMMCDVDEDGNIISTETIQSDVVYT